MKKKIIVGSIIIFLFVIGGMITIMRQPDPQQLVILGLENLNKANSFSYALTQQQTVDGKARLLTRITGYKSGENIQIQGQLAGSKVEMIKVGDVLYNKDPFSKAWVKFSDVSVAQKVFLVELNPLASLQLKEIGEVMLKGEKELNSKKCWVCTLKPSVQNQMMETLWTGFEYTLYITRSTKTVTQVEVRAQNKETGEPMTLILEFKDIGRKISIQPPETAE
ncbi:MULTISPECIES: hypothetical protein [Dehalobacter]|jgi:hypothetical protein|uniref:Uncharacterized protein n=2 Tax=Dehalobacter restrictus TaxID=55583 RepID=A0A857DKQ2_9FIRM|nr:MULTISPECIES: hypothetical protein [Dehalobacter]AHF10663.1 hypothetical protein DEHRE_11810 [Dehalobacter restrictus DSM 9455]MCG1026362.1 hypothetical protein [Dehalobacter sp.]MDJ0305514.1 hypothetical protein [Dehalobacter sp.]OCZ54650.1 hypothetical protein A7D23_04725 [Dehalobacter sp. TeCB1]QHA01291.1 hypothetical protein GQ588_11895 [Dehalobacter restrictus]